MVCLCLIDRETSPHTFQLDLFFNNVSKPSAPVFDRLGRYVCTDDFIRNLTELCYVDRRKCLVVDTECRV